MKNLFFLSGALLTIGMSCSVSRADKFLTPNGAGTKDGSSWANALDASSGGLQAGWDALKPGQTLWVGSGEYSGAKLTIASGGEKGQLKTLAGKDTGAGLPLFTGTFDKQNPAKTGANFITLSNGADYWSLQDLQVRGASVGLATKDGGHEGVRIRNFDVSQCREGMVLYGGATAENPELGSNDWEIRDCEFVDFTKRGIRFRNGNYNFQLVNCVADAGGKVWATEPFQIGFAVEGDDAARKAKKPAAHDHDLTFTNCVALNSYHNKGKGYWNADGYSAERGVKNLRFINCLAFDNTDGGWDSKAENVLLENCVSMGNKRNYRFWDTTKLVNCLSASSVWPGGSGGTTGLWTNGNVTVENSTFYDSGFSPDAEGKIVVINSIYARSKANPGTAPLGQKRDGVILTDTIFWDETTGQGENPQFVNPLPLWNGQGDNFNNRKFGADKGFFSTATNLPVVQRKLPLVSGHVALEKEAAAKAAANAAAEAREAAKTPEQRAREAAMLPQLANGSFENDVTGWEKVANSQIKTEGAAEGKKFLKVTSTGQRIEIRSKITDLVEGEKYSLSFQSRSNTSKSVRIILRNPKNKSYLTQTAPSEAATWTTKTLKFTAPSSEVPLEISVRSAGTFDLDDLVVQRIR